MKNIKPIIGREFEKQYLENLYNSNKYEFCVISGRRRIGKTYLLKSFFEDKKENDNCLFFYFSGVKEITKRKMILELLQNQFANNLLNNDIYDYKNDNKITSFEDFFNLLTHFYVSYCKTNSVFKNKKFVIVLDEISWLNAYKSNFLSYFSNFINTSVDSFGFKLFVSGSSPTWIKKNIINNDKTLFNRKTGFLKLERFSLKETKDLLLSKDIYLSDYEIMKYYMLFGGIPYYLNFIEFNRSFEDFINHHFLSTSGIFYKEFDFLFNSLFDDQNNNGFYKQVVEILSLMPKKFNGLPLEIIVEKMIIKNNLELEVGLDKTTTEYKSFYGKIYNILQDLIECDFVLTQNFLFQSSKEKRYLIKDSYCYLYLHFIKNNLNKKITEQQIKTHLGLSFEIFCLLNIDLIKEQMGIKGIDCEIYAWQNNKAQIDLLLYRADKVLTICECKFFENKVYEIDKNEYENLINKKQELLNYLENKKVNNRYLIKNVRNIDLALITLHGTKLTKTNFLNFHNVILK